MEIEDYIERFERMRVSVILTERQNANLYRKHKQLKEDNYFLKEDLARAYALIRANVKEVTPEFEDVFRRAKKVEK